MELSHRIVQALIIRAIQNILVKKCKIQLTDYVIEEVGKVATEDIMTVKDVYKSIK